MVICQSATLIALFYIAVNPQPQPQPQNTLSQAPHPPVAANIADSNPPNVAINYERLAKLSVAAMQPVFDNAVTKLSTAVRLAALTDQPEIIPPPKAGNNKPKTVAITLTGKPGTPTEVADSQPAYRPKPRPATPVGKRLLMPSPPSRGQFDLGQARIRVRDALANGVWTDLDNQALRTLSEHMDSQSFAVQFLQPVISALQSKQLDLRGRWPEY